MVVAYLAVGTVTGNDAKEARDQMRSHAIAVKTVRVYLSSQQNKTQLNTSISRLYAIGQGRSWGFVPTHAGDEDAPSPAGCPHTASPTPALSGALDPRSGSSPSSCGTSKCRIS